MLDSGYRFGSYLVLFILKFCNPFTQFLLKQGFVGQAKCILLSIDVGFLWQREFYKGIILALAEENAKPLVWFLLIGDCAWE